MKTPEGYVETRSACEMRVDSMEAAGVEQNYPEEIEKCMQETEHADQLNQETVAPVDTESSSDVMAGMWEMFAGLLENIAEWLMSIPRV